MPYVFVKNCENFTNVSCFLTEDDILSGQKGRSLFNHYKLHPQFG